MIYMNITDAIALANASKDRSIPFADADKFWDDKEYSLTQRQVERKTFESIKLIESLVKRDTEKKYLDPDNMELRLSMRTLKNAKIKKVVPHTRWMTILDKDGKAVYACTYKDAASGKSLFLDKDGLEIVSAKGWKELRKFFETGEPVKQEKPAKEPKQKNSKKVVSEEASDENSKEIITIKTPDKMEPKVEVSEVEVSEEDPEIPEELVG